jgi:hypothetical protein
VLLLRATTTALGTRAPVASVTVPLMAPWPPVCASATGSASPKHTSIATTRGIPLIHLLAEIPFGAPSFHMKNLRIAGLLKSLSFGAIQTSKQNGSTILIDLLARTGIYGIAETNVNRKIIPSFETIVSELPRRPTLALAGFAKISALKLATTIFWNLSKKATPSDSATLPRLT